MPTRNLQDDLNDFLALVPVDQVLTIALDYLANDSEVQEFVVYLQSEEFHKIILAVEELQEFKDVSITMYALSFPRTYADIKHIFSLLTNGCIVLSSFSTSLMPAVSMFMHC